MKKLLLMLAMILSTVTLAKSNLEQFENDTEYLYRCTDGGPLHVSPAIILKKKTICFQYSTPVECIDEMIVKLDYEKSFTFYTERKKETSNKVILKTSYELPYWIIPDNFLEATIKLTLKFKDNGDLKRIVLSEYKPLSYKRLYSCNVE